MMSCVCLRRALTRTLLSRAPMASVINRFFNSERCCPFSSNNGPVLRRDWDVDTKIPSDVLYVGTCCFCLCDISRGQEHDYPQLVAFGIRPWATDCSWPQRSPFCEWITSLTVPNYTHRYNMWPVNFNTMICIHGSSDNCLPITLKSQFVE